MMRTFKLTVAYDGSGYHGFQRQPRDITVQQVLEDALSRITGENVVLAGSGRTDSGVHARGQVVSFTTGCGIPAGNLKRAMNSILPPDITVIASQEAEEGFHARFSAKWKRYCYRIVLNGDYDPFIRNYAWQMQNTKLNIETMNMAAGFLLGTHDFSFFRSSGSVQSSPVKTIYKAVWQEKHRAICFLLLKVTVFYTAWCATLCGTLLKQGSAEKAWNSLRKNLIMRSAILK